MVRRLFGFLRGGPAPDADREQQRTSPAERLRYAAAQTGRLVGDWFPANQNINMLVSQASPLVRSRMRQLVRDFPPFARAVNSLVKYTVGTGFQFQSHAALPDGSPDKRARAAIEEAWRVFCEEADAAGSPALRLSLHELAALARRQDCEQGEFLAVFQERRDRRDALLPFGLAFYESERLTALHARAENGNEVHDGVEYDRRTGAIAAFHLLEDGYARRVFRVPAERAVFGLNRLRVGQLRGITPFAPALLLARDLGMTMDAEIDAAKLASKWLAVVKTPDAAGYQRERITGQDEEGRSIENMENAILEYLEPGEDIEIKSHQRGGENFQSFTRFILRLVAITVDLPYEILSGDTSGLNYSTLRVIRNDFAQALAPDQRRHISQFYQPVFRHFLDEAVLRGRLRLPGYWSEPWRYRRGLWIPPGMKPVDPLREFKAAAEAINAGLRSPQEVILERGGDPERVLAELADWRRMQREHGLDGAGAEIGTVSTALANNPAAVAGENDENDADDGNGEKAEGRT
ncbi:MAG: phage portal protein [Desulfovibrio sp.]